MSVEAVKRIVARAVAEPEFRARLLRQPEQALACYTLSEAETAALTALRPETFDAAAAELGARVSQAAVPLNLITSSATTSNAQPDGTITDQGISSEVVLAHELTHPSN